MEVERSNRVNTGERGTAILVDMILCRGQPSWWRRSGGQERERERAEVPLVIVGCSPRTR